jgi:hypothetical protein
MEMSQGNTLQNHLKMAKTWFFFFFFKNGEHVGKTSPVWGLVPVGGRG